MTATRYVWSRDKITMEKDGAGNTTKTYTQGVGQYGPLVSENSASSSRQYHFDALGSTRALTDENEDVTDIFIYDAWGNTKESFGSTNPPYQFVGKSGYEKAKNTGSYYVRARVYSGIEGRWDSADPLFLIDSLNLYQYCLNNAVLHIDPTGEGVTIPKGRKEACLTAR